MIRLGDADIRDFIANGFLRIDGAFPRAVAAEACRILWRDAGCDPDDPATWTRPVIRLGQYADAPFAAAANTPVLHAAFDRLVGPGAWQPRKALGTFPIRFPSPEDPGDAGWHIDTSFAAPGDDQGDFLAWRSNISSRGRALLLLFLFTDIGPEDAPTRIRAGSHIDIARRLAPAGEAGLSLRELAADGFSDSAARPEAAAIGEAGTVYLCHPFLVHAAQPHRGTRPRIIAQPPLAWAEPRPAGVGSPVEEAIRLALSPSANP